MAHYRAELTGVFGDPVDDNPTGVLEEAAYAALGLNYRYLTMKVLPEDLETAIAAVKAMHFRGINLTMPHKIKVIPLLDELSEAAKIIGAVNTVINDDGKLTGENTDGKGFTTALKNNNVKISGAKIMILGAGGAARAIAVECALNGAEHIYIVNRTQVSGNELARLINEKTSCSAEFVPWTENLPVPEETDILINATPIGFTPNQMHRPDIDYDTVREGMAAADVVSVFAHGETGRKQRVLHARLEAPSPGERLLHRETEGDGPVMVFLLLDAARVVVGNLDARERVVSDIGRGKCLEEVGILLPCAYVARQLEARSVRLRHA